MAGQALATRKPAPGTIGDSNPATSFGSSTTPASISPSLTTATSSNVSGTTPVPTDPNQATSTEPTQQQLAQYKLSSAQAYHV